MSGTKRVSNIDHGGQTKTTGLPTPTGTTDATNKQYVDDGVASAKARVNHTGTQPASTISDFDTQVRTNRLDQLAAPTSPLSLNGQRIANLALATQDTDSAQWGQVKELISGRRKADVKVVAVAPISLTGTQTIDGVSLVAGDRVLAVAQADGSKNGIWVVAAGAWARAADADDVSEFATQWLVTVAQGTGSGDTLWSFATDGAITLETTPLRFQKIGPLTGADRDGYVTTSPAVAAGGAWTVSHGLSTLFVMVQVRRSGAPMDFVDVYARVLDANSVSIEPDVAFALGEYTALVKKIA